MGRPLHPTSADEVSHVLSRTTAHCEQWFLTPFSVDPLCEGLGKQRWIPPNKESFCRLQKFRGGVHKRFKFLNL